jgi:hypothetical protein
LILVGALLACWGNHVYLGVLFLALGIVLQPE